MKANIQRTAGPLGRWFGFYLELGRLSFSLNAGWYVLLINWRGFGYIHLTTDPWQVETYRKGDL